MRLEVRLTLAVLALVACLGLGVWAAGPAMSKYGIDEIMDKVFDKNKGLLGKVVSGKASNDDKQQMLELYVALARNKPHKGEISSWRKKTGVLVDAALEVVNGEQGAIKKLQAAADCKGCHNIHR